MGLIRTVIPSPNGLALARKDTVYTLEEIRAMIEQYSKQCAAFGKAYNPLKKCKFCHLRMLCSVANSKKAKVLIDNFTKDDYHTEHYVDEYLKNILDKEKMHYLRQELGRLVIKHGKKVSFEWLRKLISNPKHPLYYIDYMETHDPFFPWVIACDLKRFDELEVDISNETIKPLISYAEYARAKAKAEGKEEGQEEEEEAPEFWPEEIEEGEEEGERFEEKEEGSEEPNEEPPTSNTPSSGSEEPKPRSKKGKSKKGKKGKSKKGKKRKKGKHSGAS